MINIREEYHIINFIQPNLKLTLKSEQPWPYKQNTIQPLVTKHYLNDKTSTHINPLPVLVYMEWLSQIIGSYYFYKNIHFLSCSTYIFVIYFFHLLHDSWLAFLCIKLLFKTNDEVKTILWLYLIKIMLCP